MHVYPVYEHKGVPEAPQQSRHVDDCPVYFSPECQDDIRFAKCSLHATLSVGATRFVDQPVTAEIEVTIPPKHEVNMTTIVEIDLVGYSTIARSLEESLDAEAVYGLNQSIQGLIDSALDKVGVSRANALVTNTGDGAILAIGNAETAHHFAVSLHHRSGEHNKTVKEPLSNRAFRVGIATGKVVSRIGPDGTRAFGGVTIANAVRLESRSNPGDITVDEATFLAFPAEVQRLYTETRVAGKRKETFRAFRYCPIPTEKAGLVGPAPSAPTPGKPADRRMALKMITGLYPEAQLDRLMYLQEIPINY
jgi:class 3 adenylate cyclase